MTIRDELDDLFLELDKELRPMLEDGDITNKTIADHFGCSENAAMAKMNKLVKSGAWKRIEKRSANCAKVITYRKVVI
jgi:DNA-binding Lrp family transcriptional regulator